MANKSLYETHLDIALQWHPTLNGGLTAKDVSFGSHQKIWWKCEKGDDHEWKMSVASRASQGQGCSICRGMKAVESNCLATLNPGLSNEWHPILNRDLKPNDVIPGTSKKVWWKCTKGDDHEWEAAVKNRSNGAGCPICTGRKAVLSNCLKTLYPEISSEWHPDKNVGLTPILFVPGSHKKVWWKCEKGDDHEWIASIGQRTGEKTGCPVCEGLKVVKSNSLETTHPQLCKEWDYSKNENVTPKSIIAGSSKKVWWRCEKNHGWEAPPNRRTSKKSGCPICTNQMVGESNSLNTINPQLSKEWHPTKNILTSIQVSAKSNFKVWWKCENGDDHEWEARIVDRYKNGCPICTGRKVGTSNSLAYLHPEIKEIWHYQLNGNIVPESVIANSHKRLWWKCKEGEDHVWRASPNSILQNRKRTKTNGCPVCRGILVVKSNGLNFIKPEISKEWHFDLNTKGPEGFTIKSAAKVWWKCKNDPEHIWKATISNRTNGSNCPYCDLTPQSKQELTITFELMTLFKNINPKGFKTHLDGRLRAIDIYVPKLNLCIEFDGHYWHKGKQDLDRIKSEFLFEEGFKLIRVREEPLKMIYDTDVISRKPYDGKQVTNDILSVIMQTYDLEEALVSRIKDYQYKNKLQNQEGLNRYIDKILTEKADMKRNFIEVSEILKDKE